MIFFIIIHFDSGLTKILYIELSFIFLGQAFPNVLFKSIFPLMILTLQNFVSSNLFNRLTSMFRFELVEIDNRHHYIFDIHKRTIYQIVPLLIL